jgi:steroid delta-isomerase-like uncharacterized protein
MTATEYQNVIERYFGAWNSGDLAVFDEIIAPDYINHSPATPNPPPGPVGLKPIVTAIRNAFPDIHYTIQDMVIGEGKVAIRLSWTGTHQGDFFGIPPTGKKVKVDVMQIEYIKNGQIIEHWRRTDDLGFRQQLGLINHD